MKVLNSLLKVKSIGKEMNAEYGPKMFKIGTYVTLSFVFLPAILHLLLWIGGGF